ncbi:hypothetical protein Tco_1279877, partial [Tanacetum coccineum]
SRYDDIELGFELQGANMEDMG